VTSITPLRVSQLKTMARTVIRIELLRKLAIAGQNAEFSSEDIIAILRTGIAVEQLLDLIESGLIRSKPSGYRIV
jgi:hypothetical protein